MIPLRLLVESLARRNTRVSNEHGSCTQTIKILCPNLTVRLSIPPACRNKGLNVHVEERCMFAESNRFAVVVLSD